MAENRTFLLCVDTPNHSLSLQNENVRFEQSRNVRFPRWPGAATLRGLRAHTGRRALGPGRIAGEPRDLTEVDGEGQLVVPPRATRKDHPCVAGAARQFRGVSDAG